jgi:hypothetical protein
MCLVLPVCIFEVMYYSRIFNSVYFVADVYLCLHNSLPWNFLQALLCIVFVNG